MEYLALQHRQNGSVWLNLECYVDDHGDFSIVGHDIGSDSEYEWVRIVRARHIPQLLEALGAAPGENLMDIIRRDYLPVEGLGLERLITSNKIKNEFSNFGEFPL